MLNNTRALSKVLLIICIYIAITMQVELSGTNYTTNNSAVLLDEIGENSNPLVCRIDL